MQVYISRNGARTGPFTEEQVRGMLNGGLISLEDTAWRDGMSDWKPVRVVLGLPQPAQPPTPQSAPGAMASELKWAIGIVVVILAFMGLNSGRSIDNRTGAATSISSGAGRSSTSRSATTSDFRIVSYRGEWRYDTLWIIGELKNAGSVAGGPKLQVIARDSSGVLVDSKTFWPNSTTNLGPGETCGIEHPISDNRRAQTLEVKVLDVSRW